MESPWKLPSGDFGPVQATVSALTYLNDRRAVYMPLTDPMPKSHSVWEVFIEAASKDTWRKRGQRENQEVSRRGS